MSKQEPMDAMFAKYAAQAKKSKRENRMIFNHVCVRVEDLDAAVNLFRESFGIDGFLSPGGETFDEEKEFRVAWLDEHNMYLELSEFDRAQAIGYDTGVGQEIGHLSEIGFFVPDMEKAVDDLSSKGWEVTSRIEVEGAKMYKISNLLTPGIPVELIDYEADDWTV
jgi:catechol 2,3-dioxygenase-like lactoylglutathione lyase family enzyme